MGVTLYAVVLNEKGVFHDLFPGSLFLADG
jgi:hypothetical protein